MNAVIKFEKLQDKQCEEIVKFLINQKICFSLFCHMNQVRFTPELPQNIMENFAPISLFILNGYAFESLSIIQGGIGFEAGFGKENIGSFVEIDFRDILQIIVQNAKEKDVPIFTRLAADELFFNSEEEELKKSMEAIMSNPHNQQYL